MASCLQHRLPFRLSKSHKTRRSMTLATPPVDAKTARAALAAQWQARDPKTPEEILQFYREVGPELEDDLEAFHRDPERKKWQEGLAHIAKTFNAKHTIDVGCGAGHDLRLLRDVGIERGVGVEPNKRLRKILCDEGFEVIESIATADIETADV